MENKTAMQMLIDRLSEAKSAASNEKEVARINGANTEGAENLVFAYSFAIKAATELLTTEKEQIKDAFNKAREWNEPVQKEFESDAEFYYNQTYKP